MFTIKKKYLKSFIEGIKSISLIPEPIINPVNGDDKKRLSADWKKIAGDFNKSYNTIVKEMPRGQQAKQKLAGKHA